MFKTLIFDLGNVIVPFEIERGLRMFAAGAGRPAAELGNGKIFGSEESRLFETGRMREEEFFQKISQKLGLEMDFAEFAAAWNGIFLLEPIISEDLIVRLAEKYRLLVLSDTNELHLSFIRQNFPLLKHFDDYVVSYEVGCYKPAPEMFQRALEKAGCRPEECLFTDDKKENTDRARSFGFRTVHFLSAEQFETELRRMDLL